MVENKWRKYGNYAVHIYKRRFSVELIKKVLIDWGEKKGYFRPKVTRLIKELFGTFFNIIVVYDSYQKSHVRIATRSTQKTNQFL